MLEAVPRPEGWIGTTSEWTQGLGILLTLLNIVVLLVAWRRLQRAENIRGVIGTLFFGLAVLPVVVMFFGYTHGIPGMETVRACGGCHTMTSHVEDLRDLKSESLAAVHYKNRYILENQCYTCHSDYGMLGTISAKMDGVGHVLHYVAGTYPQPIKIRHPYSNVRCLACHGESQKFLQSPGHPAEVRPQLMSGELSCLTCHAPAHTPREAKP
ncbi:MAG TPA: NapC/NirT family cytochrome c [Candidatus Methylomirabilis sp.]|nr:NapC/NirT family cytochrome c [Candidatus Methylomirabilis sp.]